MAQTITKGIKALLAEANKVVTTIPLDEAKALVDSDRHVLVDLRDIFRNTTQNNHYLKFLCIDLHRQILI